MNIKHGTCVTSSLRLRCLSGTHCYSTAHLSQEDVSKEEVKLSQAACEEESLAWPGRYREQAHLCGYGPAAGEGGRHPRQEDASQVQEEEEVRPVRQLQ